MSMATILDRVPVLSELLRLSWSTLAVISTTGLTILIGTAYIALYLVAPQPRPTLPAEKRYKTVLPDGSIVDKELPCWTDNFNHHRQHPNEKAAPDHQHEADEAEVFMSVVIPAYNEEYRLGGMLEEAVGFLQRMYGSSEDSSKATAPGQANGKGHEAVATSLSAKKSTPAGWEIIIVSDGSTDDTVATALTFAHNHITSQSHHPAIPGPRTPRPSPPTHISPGSIRVVSLSSNRGKGGAVTHGLRHIRGQYAIFADADGATRFSDLSSLLSQLQGHVDDEGRGVAVGSRAHLVGSPTTVQRSALRNLLMYGFHIFLWIMTPPATARIRDTQCGFKLFSRPALKYIVPYMHAEGWHFDVEMLMLAEYVNIPVVEVPVAWKEVGGSKLNVVWDSIGMAWGLAVLRLAWMTGVYNKRI